MKIKAKKGFHFDAAHCLPGHSGKCASMHGHTYRLEVVVAREDGGLISEGSSEGMIIDFGDLNRIVKEEILDKVDHHCLNDLFTFRTTSENLAVHFFAVLSERLQASNIVLDRILLWESSTSCVEVER